MGLRTLGVLAAVILCASACSSSSPAGVDCASNDACTAGSVCVEEACRKLCDSDLLCDAGTVCEGSICVPVTDDTARQAPEIERVDGTGSTPERIRDRLVITGRNLAGSGASLEGASSAQLAVLSSGPTELVVELPPSLSAGDYVLRVANVAGADQEELRILQGEKGDTGEPGQPGQPATAEQVIVMLRGVDGPGSGLDADLLDGMDASQLVRSDTSDFVRTSGGIINGDLSVLGGLLGIGTSSAAGALDVRGSAAGFVAQPPAVSTLSNSGLVSFNAAQALDGATDTVAWHTDTSSNGAWMQIDLGAGSRAAYSRLRLYAGGAGSAALYDVQHSDDGSIWSTVYGSFRPHQSGWNVATWLSSGAHRYWRLLLTNAPGAGPRINELELYASGEGTALLVEDSGRVGLGTDAPLERLHVEGGMVLNGALRGSAVRYAENGVDSTCLNGGDYLEAASLIPERGTHVVIASLDIFVPNEWFIVRLRYGSTCVAGSMWTRLPVTNTTYGMPSTSVAVIAADGATPVVIELLSNSTYPNTYRNARLVSLRVQ